MKSKARIGLLLLGCAGPMVAACSDAPRNPVEPSSSTTAGSAAIAPQAAPGGAGRLLFQARLRPEGDSGSVGVLHVEIAGGSLHARVRASGLEPLQPIPQHIHLNPTCSPGGGILINLDDRLTVAGEGPGVGPAYPRANVAGVVVYDAARPLADLMAAVNTYQGANVATVDELLAWLNLEHRNAHMHVAFGPPFPAVNCGEIEQLH